MDSTINTNNKDDYKHTAHIEYEPCNSFKNKLGFTKENNKNSNLKLFYNGVYGFPDCEDGAVGVNVEYDNSNKKLTKLEQAIWGNIKDTQLTVIHKCDINNDNNLNVGKFEGHLFKKLDNDTKIGIKTELDSRKKSSWDKKITYTVGFEHKYDSNNQVKMKINNEGNMTCQLNRKLNDKLKLGVKSDWNLMTNKEPKLGFGLTFT